MKKTLVIGASTNPERYSFKAIQSLRRQEIEVLAFGLREGVVNDVSISTHFPNDLEELDSITLYINPERQKAFYESLLSLHPKRIIFNPGTENPELEQLAAEAGIEVVEACTLVMLATGQY